MTLSEIYEQYSSLVYNVALQYTQNRHDAEEITQDVFLRIHNKLSTFEEKSQLKTWIYKIAVNKSLDFLRAKKSQKRWTFSSKNRVADKELSVQDSQMNHPGIQLEQ